MEKNPLCGCFTVDLKHRTHVRPTDSRFRGSCSSSGPYARGKPSGNIGSFKQTFQRVPISAVLYTECTIICKLNSGFDSFFQRHDIATYRVRATDPIFLVSRSYFVASKFPVNEESFAVQRARYIRARFPQVFAARARKKEIAFLKTSDEDFVEIPAPSARRRSRGWYIQRSGRHRAFFPYLWPRSSEHPPSFTIEPMLAELARPLRIP